MTAFTIKDLENLSGIKAHTIRIWEQRYTFLKPNRTDTNIRYYSNEQLKVVLNIALLNKYGFKISHIDKMSEKELNDKILSLSNVQAQQERTVNLLIQHMVDLDMDNFELELDHYIDSKGVERTITQIIFPFLERIGILWLTNHINPAQEHLVSNIIRQKLLVGIEKSNSPISHNKTVLMFLPSGEHHELGLLFAYYLLKSRGIKILYIGANIPLKDVEYVANLRKPEFLYTHLTSVAANFNFPKFLQTIGTQLKNYKLLVSGKVVNQYKKKLPDNVSFKNTFEEILSTIVG